MSVDGIVAKSITLVHLKLSVWVMPSFLYFNYYVQIIVMKKKFLRPKINNHNTNSSTQV